MVTDGPFDMGRFLYLQTRHIGMAFPHSYASTWANLRKCFANFYKGDFYGGNSTNNNPSNRLPGLQSMLDMLGNYILIPTLGICEIDLHEINLRIESLLYICTFSQVWNSKAALIRVLMMLGI